MPKDTKILIKSVSNNKQQFKIYVKYEENLIIKIYIQYD
jgi:hypothetical protein